MTMPEGRLGYTTGSTAVRKYCFRVAYNELGQLTSTRHHSRNGGNTYIYAASYQFTIQGWLKQKQYRYPGGASIFTEQLVYNDAHGTANAPRYDGWPLPYAGNMRKARVTGPTNFL